MAESCPKFLRPQLDQLVGACIGNKKYALEKYDQFTQNTGSNGSNITPI